jgi:aspartyl-tRNA(Asn)/glutamyl-tRNA(Gln) amidotransferase subunit A
MEKLIQLSALDLRALFRARKASPVEVLDAFIQRIEKVDAVGGAFVATCFERARKEARAAETEYARGANDKRPLLGLPFAAKDLFDSENLRTACGSPMLAENVPPRDAEALSRVRAAGGILVGKTQTHEWAWGITSVNLLLGSARNPWDTRRISGGSSGGSAVALALDEVPLALGSDTGGSIRVPAAFCGVVGHKPTWGRVSGSGTMALARSLDHPGPMARTPTDAALLLDVIAGVDSLDPATEDRPLDLREVGSGLRGLRIALCPDLHLVELTPDVATVFDETVSLVRSLGADVIQTTLPESSSIYPTFVTIQRAEALRTHQLAGLYPDRRDEYGHDVRRRLDAATAVTIAEYLDASAERQRIRARFAQLFRDADLLLTPVSAGPPTRPGDEVVSHLGRDLEVRELVMSYTAPQDLVGIPSTAVRAGFDSLKLPIGVQFSAAPWRDELTLRAAQALWQATPDVQAPRPS